MTRQTTPSVASARPRRSGVGRKSKLAVRNREDGFVYRIVNSNLERDPDRVEELLEQGYEIVPKAESSVGEKRVDSPSSLGSSSLISVGQGTKATLMRIREDWYKEDQAGKQALVDATEQTMKKPANVDYGKLEIKTS